jgi:hypothetical protein
MNKNSRRERGMTAIEKTYFALEEVGEHWGVPFRDLVYLAENGLLKVSVRLYDVLIEQGVYEEIDTGRWCRIPEEQGPFRGLLDLRAEDAYRLFREGACRIHWFDAPGQSYCFVLQPDDGILLRREELVVRREERDRAEARHGLGGEPKTSEILFAQRRDYSEVTLGDRTFKFGPIQARVVCLLHEAAESGSPWRCGKVVLAEAGSSCTRLSDLFKTQPHWRRLIQSDRRGCYRLNTKFF